MVVITKVIPSDPIKVINGELGPKYAKNIRKFFKNPALVLAYDLKPSNTLSTRSDYLDFLKNASGALKTFVQIDVWDYERIRPLVPKAFMVTSAGCGCLSYIVAQKLNLADQSVLLSAVSTMLGVGGLGKILLAYDSGVKGCLLAIQTLDKRLGVLSKEATKYAKIWGNVEKPVGNIGKGPRDATAAAEALAKLSKSAGVPARAYGPVREAQRMNRKRTNAPARKMAEEMTKLRAAILNGTTEKCAGTV